MLGGGDANSSNCRDRFCGEMVCCEMYTRARFTCLVCNARVSIYGIFTGYFLNRLWLLMMIVVLQAGSVFLLT